MKKRSVKPAAAALEPLQATAPAPLTIPRFGSLWRLFIYPLCVIVPGAGVVLGLLYARQDDKEARNFGRICLALGILGAMLRMGSGMDGVDRLNQPLY